jgi:flagellar biosynthesis protein FliR
MYLISIAQAQLFFLAFTRIMAVMVQIPLLGGNSIPAQVRIAFGLILAIVLVPWTPLPADSAPILLLPFVFAILKEMIIGMIIGFVVALTFGAFQIASKLMEQGAGFSAGQLFNPTIGELSSAYDQFFLMIVFMYFLSIDGYHIIIIAMQRIFVALPINSAIPAMVPGRLLFIFSTLLVNGFQMALPVMGALLLADLTLGILARVAPQMNVFFLGLPAKIWLGVIALGMTISTLLPFIGKLIQSMGPRMLQIIGA